MGKKSTFHSHVEQKHLSPELETSGLFDYINFSKFQHSVVYIEYAKALWGYVREHPEIFSPGTVTWSDVLNNPYTVLGALLTAGVLVRQGKQIYDNATKKKIVIPSSNAQGLNDSTNGTTAAGRGKEGTENSLQEDNYENLLDTLSGHQNFACIDKLETIFEMAQTEKDAEKRKELENDLLIMFRDLEPKEQHCLEEYNK